MSSRPAKRSARVSLARVRAVFGLLALTTLLAGCEGGSGQSGNAFVFLSVDGFSLGAGSPTATVNSSIDTGTTTVACVTLRNNLKNPTVTASNALNNVIVQSYTVTLTSISGGALPGPFTFGTAVIVPAGTQAAVTGVLTGNTATFPVVLVPASAKLDPRVRPPNRLPIIATAEVEFRGRDGRGNSVEAEGAVTVVFLTGGEDSEASCAGATGGNGNGNNGGTGGAGGTGTGGTTT
jgi:hypothetical protein